MELNKNIRICDLFDLYGSLLSKKQGQMINEHYYMDMSLSEIAQNLSISRQAVQDSINKSVLKLEDFESKLKMLEIKKQIEKLQGTQNDQNILQSIKKIF